MATAVEKIQEEHKDYGRVLRSLREAVKDLQHKEWRRQAGQGREGEPGYRPNLDLLFSCVYYIRVFPDKCANGCCARSKCEKIGAVGRFVNKKVTPGGVSGTNRERGS